VLLALLLAVLAFGFWAWHYSGISRMLPGQQRHRHELHRQYLTALAREEDAYFATQEARDRVSRLAGEMAAGIGDPEGLLAQLGRADEEVRARERVWTEAVQALDAVRQQAREEFGDDPAFRELEQPPWTGPDPLARPPRR
jgi:hypothetical protein